MAEKKEKTTKEVPVRTMHSTLEAVIIEGKPVILLVKGAVICGTIKEIDGPYIRVERGMQADSLLGFTRGGIWVLMDSIDGIGEA